MFSAPRESSVVLNGTKTLLLCIIGATSNVNSSPLIFTLISSPSALIPRDDTDIKTNSNIIIFLPFKPLPPYPSI